MALLQKNAIMFQSVYLYLFHVRLILLDALVIFYLSIFACTIQLPMGPVCLVVHEFFENFFCYYRSLSLSLFFLSLLKMINELFMACCLILFCLLWF